MKKEISKLPIGIFDSGLGGLTVVKEVRSLLPNENIIYFGDIARLPYGNKSQEVIRRFSIENSIFLINQEVKLIVVACNTASSLALSYLREIFRLPFIGVIEPLVKQAIRLHPKRIAVIGTEATIKSRSYQESIKSSVDYSVIIKATACPLFVPMIEAGIINGEFCDTIIENQINPIKKFRPDVLLLGCTHYPIIRDTLQKVLGGNCEVLCSSTATAIAVKQFLLENNTLNKDRKKKGWLKIFVSDVTEGFEKLARLFLNSEDFEIRRSRPDVLY